MSCFRVVESHSILSRVRQPSRSPLGTVAMVTGVIQVLFSSRLGEKCTGRLALQGSDADPPVVGLVHSSILNTVWLIGEKNTHIRRLSCCYVRERLRILRRIPASVFGIC